MISMSSLWLVDLGSVDLWQGRQRFLASRCFAPGEMWLVPEWVPGSAVWRRRAGSLGGVRRMQDGCVLACVQTGTMLAIPISSHLHQEFPESFLQLDAVPFPDGVAPANAGSGEASEVPLKIFERLREELEPTYRAMEERYGISW